MKPKRVYFWRKFGRIAGYSALCCFCLGVVYVFFGMFTIKNIIVVGKNIELHVDETRLPKTLLLFPSAAIRAGLLQENPILADIQFEKEYPNTLRIIPTLRTPLARLTLVARDVLIDQSGIVIAEGDPSQLNLPHIIIPLPAVRIGEKISDTRVIAALSFLSGTRDVLPVQTIILQDESSLRASSNKLNIVFPQDGFPAILTTLQTLLTGFRIKGTLPTYIDLRFNKPVVIF